MNSECLAQIAQDISFDYKLEFNVKGRQEISEMGMGAFESVAQGTETDPKLITITVPGRDRSRKVALVGKGLTFDSGGISLKPSLGMGEMKYDLCGGAAVIGVAHYLAKVSPPTDVVCVVGAVENLPGRMATRPGDVVTTMSGKTVEILNTDAEGRLVLCDLLHYVQKQFKPEFIIDTATLTGAVLMALGSVGSALISDNDRFCEYVLRVSKDVGEPLWRLPLWPEFKKEVKSDIADLKNIANPNVRAGTILAGVFLKEFIQQDTLWAHIDIAGTAWNCQATGFQGSGGTGFILRTMASACLQWEKQTP
jgi:leucyl aminopeptidase